MIKVTVDYYLDTEDYKKELEIIRRAYTEALKNKKMTDVEIIQNTLLTGAKSVSYTHLTLPTKLEV